MFVNVKVKVNFFVNENVNVNEKGQRLSLREAMKLVFKLFHKVALAKIAHVSDILQAHEVWKILLWR